MVGEGGEVGADDGPGIIGSAPISVTSTSSCSRPVGLIASFGNATDRDFNLYWGGRAFFARGLFGLIVSYGNATEL